MMISVQNLYFSEGEKYTSLSLENTYFVASSIKNM